jgi:putative ABC transport system substrate-binding protein
MLQLSLLRVRARVLGLRLLLLNANTQSGIESAFVTLAQERARLLLVSGDSFLVAQRNELVALTAQYAVPTLYHRTAAGGLMSYGPSLAEAYYQVGQYAARILEGEQPGKMPVQQFTKFDLVINLKTAKTLGLDIIPPTLLAIADEVIE